MNIKINDFLVEGLVSISNNVITVNGVISGDCSLPSPSSLVSIIAENIAITGATVSSINVETKDNKLVISLICSIVTYNYIPYDYKPYIVPNWQKNWPYRYLGYGDTTVTWGLKSTL